MEQKTQEKNNINRLNEEIRKIFENFQKSDPKGKAKIIAEDLWKIAKQMGNKNEKTTKHQVRKYYHYFLDILESSTDENFHTKLPKIAIANSYIQYDKARKTVGNIFAKFVEEFVRFSINTDREGYKELLTLFEAFVGYTSFKN